MAMACRESGTICGVRILRHDRRNGLSQSLPLWRGWSDFVSEIYLTPAGKAQLAGTDKQVESQHHRQPQ